MLYHAECIYAPNQETRATGNQQKSSSRPRRRRLSPTNEEVVSHEVIHQTDLPEWDQVDVDQAISQHDNIPREQQATQASPQRLNEVLGQTIQTVEPNHDIAGELATAEIGIFDQMNWDEFDGSADLLGLHTSPYLPSPHEEESQGLSPFLPMEDLVPELQGGDGHRGVVGLGSFLCEPSPPADSTEVKSIPPGLVVSKDTMSSKFIGKLKVPSI